ncbi:MAG: hypothetical protein IPH08_03040 [Rhodocyclaceae bacterium]|nr:hypothetical protein [Rhodocyclaceae bacterium]MBK6906140.1 hypothetical protein [Rhodocyclaceae bacterium]
MVDDIVSLRLQAYKNKGSKLRAEKKARQARFVAQVMAENLSSAQVIERASVFPVGVESRVIHWPKL